MILYFCEEGVNPCATDTDGDGWADCEDDCINMPSSADFECPENEDPCEADSDNDGFADCDDKCVDVLGNGENDGCPEEDCDDNGDCFDIDDPCANKDLRNKKVSDDVKANEIDNRKHNFGIVVTINEFGIQEIEDGTGDINVDKYELNITSLPSGMTAQQLFEEIRINFDNIVTGSNDILSKARFGPYAAEDDNTWNSTNPLGSAMVFRTPLDNATVIATEYSLQEMFWTFTTVNSFNHWGHPVNGHRQFRLRENEDGTHTFVVRGADRLNTLFDSGANTLLGLGVRDFAFDLADDTWKNLMGTIEDYINAKSGAEVEPFDKTKEYGTRHPYNENDCK